MRKVLILLASLSFVSPAALFGQHAAPLRIDVPLPSAWMAMHDTFEEEGLTVDTEDRIKGTVLTHYREYISGPLTESYLSKIGQPPRLADASWVRAEYRFDIEFRFIEQKRTMVTVNADVRGLKRDFLGSEAWIEVPTNGSREEALLTEFGKRLFGDSFTLDGSNKRWERDRTLIPADVSGAVPKTAAPERP